MTGLASLTNLRFSSLREFSADFKIPFIECDILVNLFLGMGETERGWSNLSHNKNNAL